VTAVVITRNRVGRLEGTLRTMTELPERPHVIVIDNASTDGSPDVVEERFPGVRLIRLGRNRGAAARNTGVRHARTPYVAFSDDDSWWAPGALRAAADALDSHGDLALVAARILVGDAEALDSSCALMADSPLADGGPPGPSVLGFLACAAVVRRSAFEQVGGFRAGWGVGGEEQLLAVDLAAAGHRLAYVAGVGAHHHPPGHGHSARARRAQTMRNDLWFAWLRRRRSAAMRETVSLCAAAVGDSDARSALQRALPAATSLLCARRAVSGDLERDLRLLRRQRRAR
jgi:GT2 family glycosyltransferase